MLPEQRWSAVRGSHRREFALCSALCISNTKTHALRSLFTFFFFFKVFCFNERKKARRTHAQTQGERKTVTFHARFSFFVIFLSFFKYSQFLVDLVALLTRRDVTCGFSGKVWTVHESLKQKELPAHYFTVTRHPGEHCVH